MSPSSLCLSSSVTNTIQRQRHNPISHHSSDDNETLSTSPGQSRDFHSSRSIVPIIRHRSEIESDESANHYFSPTQIVSSRPSVEFRKKMHDIYILPVSPALSSSSSTTNTEGIIKTGSNTMPNRSRRYVSSNRGIKNDCFTDSPQPKDRTLPRLHTGQLRYFQPPIEPPPLPPTIAQIHFNQKDKSSVVNPDAITLRINTIDESKMKKTSQPPPVPCRSQKPLVLSIGSEGLTKQSSQNDSGHPWPNPPESISTSIPYDHLIPTVIMRHNTTTNFPHQYRHNEDSMLTESET